MTELEKARERVAEATKRVEAQTDILSRLRMMRGDTTRAEKLLKMLEAELAEAEKRLSDLEDGPGGTASS
jgi:exonuclease VII small subunit